MKISDIYKQKKTVFSCEVFPPKPENDIKTIYTTIKELKTISPDFVSVTYGAGGGTKTRTLEISSKIKKEYNLESLMHLTCINSSFNDITKILDAVKNNEIENILALRGDIPKNKDKKDIITDFQFAVELIDFIKKYNNFSIGAAGYPEKHPESLNINNDIEYLKNKVGKGAEFIITQLFFNNEDFYKFMDRIHSSGITVPVSAGIMPVVKAKLIIKMVNLSGATIPGKLQNLIDKYGHNLRDMEKAGIDYSIQQITNLLKQGVNGIHLYTMNNADLAKKISKNTNLR